jgi:anaerobic magnesium-protoporphyrin IX monomethyl ester cyclase
MKVTLIFPPSIATEHTLGFISVGQPLGIAYLGAALEQAGHEVTLLDALMAGFWDGPSDTAPANYVRVSRGMVQTTPLGQGFPEGSFSVGLSPEQVADRVLAGNPDVVCMSVIFTSLYRLSLRILEIIKERRPDIPTIIGGSHVTVSPDAAARHPAVDYTLTGEGELTLPSLLSVIEKWKNGKEPYHPTHLFPNPVIPGLNYDDGLKMNVSISNRIKQIDTLPFPAFHLLPMEDYFRTAAEGRMVKMYTSRGCTFLCSFCSVPVVAQQRFIAHSPERVIREVEFLIDKWQVEEIMFEDDNMSLNPKRCHRIFELLAQGNYGLRLSARNFRCDMLPLETLKLMKQSGFGTVWITPESGSQRVLDKEIGKAMKLPDVVSSVERIHAAGLSSAAAFVIGMPGEARSEIDETISFARKLKGMGVGEFWFSIATPIEGTRMYDEAKAAGLIGGMDLDRFAYNTGSFDTDQFTMAEMQELRAELMAEFNG